MLLSFYIYSFSITSLFFINVESNIYNNPGKTNNTIINEHKVPFPKKNPNWDNSPWVEITPSKNPTTVSTLADVSIDTVTDEIVFIIASFLR